jgi:hypothetical protein
VSQRLRGVGFTTLGVRGSAIADNVLNVESPSASHSATAAELQQRLDAERHRAPFLVWRDPDGQRILALDEGRARCTVGRGPEVDVGLDFDEQVSRLHAEIERIGGDWTVADDGL